ncbi:hypothetical protein Misp01_24320 [Microtetraspora sp. NBRC 13810]|uniref:hypothetical protein n=1 Tax=Microtetraspora sp. NBRC 13810 TaxID=3030990 RepID=UPI0024A2F38E|nr:hypothetical protein [Microtetraspora sp. NBRC 13810]GLW07302.1 hypothetical protein Misp01_24320 [Microtetraspora sp. NBRC 13810]
MNDAQIRLRYLERTIRLLFPGAGEPSAYSVLPHPRLPRRLVPRTWWHRPFGPAVPVPSGAESIIGHLGEVLGMPVRVVLHIRPARRANRKPVLEVHGPDGLAAYVKVGDSARARALVRNEAAALRLLADAPLKTVCPPVLLHHGEWRGLDVLVVSPLPVPRRRRPIPAQLIHAAVAEIAALDADTPSAWHGDFAPWNIARAPDGRLLVWDWERFASGVPLGFDAAHLSLSRALSRMRPPLAARSCLASATETLAPYGLSAAQAKLTVIRYLITLADRHAADGHEPLGPPARWLTPLIDHQESVL